MTTSKLISLYIANLCFFLWIGLFGGSLVHITRDTMLYGSIAVVWLLLFLLWSYIKLTVEYSHLTMRQVLSVMLASFLFAWGVGVVSGGIQHFTEVGNLWPRYIALGLPVSLFAFRAKEQIILTKNQLKIIIIGWIISAIILFFATDFLLHYIQDSEWMGSWHSTDQGSHH